MITVIHENNPDIRIRRVMDVVVGKRIKNYMFFFSCEKLPELKRVISLKIKPKTVAVFLIVFISLQVVYARPLPLPQLGKVRFIQSL